MGADRAVAADAPPDVPTDTPDAPTGCRSDADCDASTQFCRADMRCVPRECVPANSRCTAAGAREVCDPRGTTYAAMPCAPSESCRDGACVPRVCVPDAPTCAGATAVRRCNSDGLGYADPTSCPAMSACDPATNMCRSWTCVPGQRRCDANRVVVCNDDGLGETTTPCASRETCSSGACVPWVCTPSTPSCVGLTTQRRCNDDGLGYSSTTCAATSSCVDATGVCTPWACTPGTSTTCRESARLICAANGHDFAPAPCAPASNATATCTAGTCGFACNAGYGNCDDIATNGCEVALTTTAAHCGMCGRVCPSLAHATAVCAASMCAIGTCDAGYGDCDGVAANGCETDLRSPTACGRCGNACATGVACRAYACGGPTGADFVLAYGHGCARHPTGAVSCWGNNFFGELGDGTQMGYLTPVPVQGLSDAVQLSASYLHTCAVRIGGGVSCWGRNVHGALGNGTTGERSTFAVTVLGLGDAVEVAAGVDFTCALRASGLVSCWGANTHGQLGINSLVNSSVPLSVSGLSGATQVAAGIRHACARLVSGVVVCWGGNDFGQLGNGSTTNSAVPVAVLGLTDAVEVSAGALQTCARRASGSVLCWGRNDYGQLGNGTVGATSPTPVTVVDLSDATQISSGNAHACARRAPGSVVCWGAGGDGALGDGMIGISPRPVPVAGLTDAVRVVAGHSGSAVRRPGGELLRWGSNLSGQLGGRMSPILVPTVLPGFP